MAKYDWSQFKKRIPIKASKEDIFNCWTNSAGLEKWFLRRAEFTTPQGYIKPRYDLTEEGDTYKWYWHGWSDDIFEKGTILKIHGKEKLEFSFGSAGKVRISVVEEGGENILELRQYDIPTDKKAKINWHIGCGEGWTFYLTNLKSILEGGIDLRNRNENLKGLINA